LTFGDNAEITKKQQKLIKIDDFSRYLTKQPSNENIHAYHQHNYLKKFLVKKRENKENI
jgi:hypothetical protein